jgi:hypothetical protein
MRCTTIFASLYWRVLLEFPMRRFHSGASAARLKRTEATDPDVTVLQSEGPRCPNVVMGL